MDMRSDYPTDILELLREDRDERAYLSFLEERPFFVYLAGPIERERARWGLVDWNIFSDGSACDFEDQLKMWKARPKLYEPFDFAGHSFIFTGPFVGES
jgi:hypothetical protein